MDDAAPASPATPATAATAGTEGSPLKRRLSALLLSEGREREAGGAVEASPLEPGRVERLLSSEFGEDVVRLCEMIAATGAGALCGGGNPPLAPCSSTPPPPRRRLLQGDDNDDDVGEEEHGGESGGRGLPPPSTSREGAGSCASEDGSDDEIGGRQVSALNRECGAIDRLTQPTYIDIPPPPPFPYICMRRAPGRWTPSAGACCSCRRPHGTGSGRNHGRRWRRTGSHHHNHHSHDSPRPPPPSRAPPAACRSSWTRRAGRARPRPRRGR